MAFREFKGIQRDQFWELPLALERAKMSFLHLKGSMARGKMHGVIEELPLVALEGEAGSFRGGKVVISFQKWFPQSSQGSDSLFSSFSPSRLQFC